MPLLVPLRDSFIPNPDADVEPRTDMELIALATAEQREAFLKSFG